VGLKIYYSNNKKLKKVFLWVSIFFNLGLLGFFKYFNFFIDSWLDLLTSFDSIVIEHYIKHISNK